MYLVRTYRDHKRRAVSNQRFPDIGSALTHLSREMVDNEKGKWNQMKLIDVTHRTLLLNWIRGSDGRPQHPVLPGMGRV